MVAQFKDATVYFGAFGLKAATSISPVNIHIDDSLSAGIVACIWAVIWTINTPPNALTICPDNDTAIKIASHYIVPRGYAELATILIAVISFARTIHRIYFDHVPGHSDHS